VPPTWQIHRELSTARLLEDECVSVTITLRAVGPLPLVELLEPLPPRVALERGNNHAFFTLRAGQEIRWTFELRGAGRQHLRLDGPHLRLWGPLARGRRGPSSRPCDGGRLPAACPDPASAAPAADATFVGNMSPAQGKASSPATSAFAPAIRCGT
jgi:uncharacterized protein (DUF58 family)